MRIAITGSTGLIGSALIAALNEEGHSLIPVVGHARQLSAGEVAVDPSDPGSWRHSELDGVDAFIHLAGENIAARRWTPQRKSEILASRAAFTSQISKLLAGLVIRPRVLLAASAVGVYGDRKDEALEEDSVREPNEVTDGMPAGGDFLIHVCKLWEDATKPAAEAGIRVVNLRFGAVLSGRGGALAKMLLPFRLGLGGIIGSGKQYLSWVAIDDVIGAIEHALVTDTLSGPVNVVSPNPVTNREFTKTLGKVLRRPTLFPMPAFAARLAFGELADALLLASQRAVPGKLMNSGYAFRYPVLEDALRHVLRPDAQV